MTIRKDASWMQYLDERISASERRIRERFQVLAHADFVAPLGGCGVVISDHYLLTRLGIEYLCGDLDARHHHHPRRRFVVIGAAGTPRRSTSEAVCLSSRLVIRVSKEGHGQRPRQK